MSKIALVLIALVVFQLAGVAAKDPPPMTDDTITDQVRLKLTSDPDVKGGALQVDVKQGVVTLSGGGENGGGGVNCFSLMTTMVPITKARPVRARRNFLNIKA